MLDSGASEHMVSESNLGRPELSRAYRGPSITLSTANGKITHDQRVDMSLGKLDSANEQSCLVIPSLGNINLASMGRLVADGYSISWTPESGLVLKPPNGDLQRLVVDSFVPTLDPHSDQSNLTQGIENMLPHGTASVVKHGSCDLDTCVRSELEKSSPVPSSMDMVSCAEPCVDNDECMFGRSSRS